MSTIEKKNKLYKIWFEMEHDALIEKFFDWDSNKNLDLKIEVFTKLNNGLKRDEIKEYYDILENYPKDTEDDETYVQKLW